MELALLALAVWVAIRAGPWPSRLGRAPRAATMLMAIAAGGTYAFLLLGQIDGIAALGLAASYAAWRKDRPAAAGFCLALAFAATKPHLAIGLGVWLVARRDWRALGGAAAGCAVVAAVSLALVGPGGLAGFVSALGFAVGNTPGASTLGIPGLVASWLGGGHGPGGHRGHGVTDRARRLRPARGAIARQPRSARSLARGCGGTVAGGVPASPAPRPRDPRTGLRVVRGTSRRRRERAMAGSGDDPADRGVGRARRAHPRRYRERGARASGAARALGLLGIGIAALMIPSVETSRRESGAGRSRSVRQRKRRRGVDGVVVEAATVLAAEAAGIDHALEDRHGRDVARGVVAFHAVPANRQHGVET